MKKTLFLFICVILTGYALYSQGTNYNPEKNKYFYIGGNVIIQKTKVINSGSESITPITINAAESPGGLLEAGCQFSKWFGLSTGIGYSMLLTNLSLDSYSYSYDTLDSEKQTYNRIIDGNTIEETQRISFLNIPLLFNFQVPVKSKFGLYLQSGMNFSIPVKKTYLSNGTFSYTGFYPAYNVLITDIPYEDIKSNVNVDKEGQLKIKKMCPELVTSAGIWFMVRNSLHFSLGCCYNRMLTDISDYPAVSNFRLSTRTDHIRSFMEGSDNISASSLGIKISFRYIL